jgi:threonylcarbamoyladenosine tRNA methylthiotransferase MtaB
MKYSVVTFGCRVNQADSLAVEGRLLARGDTPVPVDQADFVVVNTCSVTATADQGARQTIRRIVRANPSVRVIVTGCYATRAPQELASLPNVIQVVPNARKESVGAIVAAEPGVSTAGRFNGGEGPCGSPLAPGIAGRTAFTLRVQTGCDERCSYCIIPSTRGQGQSKPLDEVIRDVERAVNAGYREIAVTGVHLGSYGRDLPEPASLLTLLERLAGFPQTVLFRISSLEPMDCTADVVSLAASSLRIAPHFHLPLQHGADAMLRVMRRPYTAAFYAALVQRIIRLMPHASIGSDMIVGFPGETDAHFEESVAVLRELPLSHLHVFPYSDRPGTEAAAMHPKVEGALIRERARRVREIGAEMTARFRCAQRGTLRRALVVDDGWSAVTDNYVKVRLLQQAERNTWVNVTLSQ